LVLTVDGPVPFDCGPLAEFELEEFTLLIVELGRTELVGCLKVVHTVSLSLQHSLQFLNVLGVG
jgi:hypothetical protein